MTYQGLRVLAVVPARSGSKRVINKNLRLLGPLSLTAHVANTVSATPIIDAAVISTDHASIAHEGRLRGLKVPFLRPPELATDYALAIDVWRHAWLFVEQEERSNYDLSVLLEPSSPFREPQDIINSIRMLIEKSADSCVTVSRNPAHFTPEKTLSIDSSGLINNYLPASQSQCISQLIPPYFHRNGACYAATRETIIDKKMIITENTVPLVIDRPMVNIDEEYDLEYANYLWERRHNWEPKTLITE